MLSELTEEQTRDEAVDHALETHFALATSNYHRFFQLYRNAPKLNGYLMDHFADRERSKAMIILCKS